MKNNLKYLVLGLVFMFVLVGIATAVNLITNLSDDTSSGVIVLDNINIIQLEKNATSNAGNWNITNPASNCYDDDFDTYCEADYGDSAEAYMNYSVIGNSTINSLIEYKDGNGQYNISINTACWGNDTLELRIQSLGHPDNYTDVSCKNISNGNWIILKQTYPSTKFYELQMHWHFSEQKNIKIPGVAENITNATILLGDSSFSYGKLLDEKSLQNGRYEDLYYNGTSYFFVSKLADNICVSSVLPIYTGYCSYIDISSETDEAKGIAVSDNYIFVSEYDYFYDYQRITKYYLNGTYTGEQINYSLSGEQPAGMTYYNDTLWVVDISEKNVKRFYENGTFIDNYYDLSSMSYPYSISFDGGFFFVNNFYSQFKTFKFYENGTLYSNFTTNQMQGISTYNGFLIGVSPSATSTAYNYSLQYENLLNPYLEVGERDTLKEWNYSGTFTSQETTNNFAEEINNYLSDCVLVDGNCTIPIYLHSDTLGRINYSDIKIEWEEYTSPTINISEPTGEKNSTNISYSVNVTDNWESDFCTYWITRGATIEVANTSVTCSDSITGIAYVSSIGTDYVIHFFANDTSGNSNYSTSNFSTSSGAVVVIPPSTGGGGSTTVIDSGVSFNMEASGGGSSFATKIILGTSRELEILYENLAEESITLEMSCEDVEGDGCKFVSFPEETFSLPLITGAKDSHKFNIIVPEDEEIGNYLFNIVAKDEQSKKGRISVDLTVTQSGIFNKLTSRTTSGFPYFIIFLASTIFIFIVSMILFKKVKIRLLLSIFNSLGISFFLLFLI